jgi:predicted AAA+ superfamily ATPase
MAEIYRNLHLDEVLKKKSVLLLGPRSTGKSYYVRNQLDHVFTINLLKSSDFLALNENPSSLEDIVALHKGQIICIDEIQKIPSLLDEAHRLIEEQKVRFLFTGSSARKLKARGVNLLAGRAWLANMFPLNSDELTRGGEKVWSVGQLLKYGSLPQVWTSREPWEELDSYVQTYIDLEIKSEGTIRKIPQFVRFLKTAALSSGELINYANVASDAGVPATTVKEHYQILEDTLVGSTLEPWLESTKRKAIATGKFYFFDCGVLNQIAGVFPQSENDPTWGQRFEQFIINEVRCANSYQRRKKPIHFWRSTSQFEVDLLFGKTAIEIKSTRKVSEKHLKGLKALAEEKSHKEFILVSQDSLDRKVDNIFVLNFRTFLSQLWKGSFS